MISARTKNGTKVYVSLCDDLGENKGGYYCEVYLDEDSDSIDNFVIHADWLEDYTIEECVNAYINSIIEY